MIQQLSTRRPAYRMIAGALCLVCAAPAASWGQGPGALTDFSLVDVNLNSPRSGARVSPRDYLQQVSGWYFGHAT